MTLTEARLYIGKRVVYEHNTAKGTVRQPGTITSVSNEFVFVEYTPSVGGVATYPEDLILAEGTEYDPEVQQENMTAEFEKEQTKETK